MNQSPVGYVSLNVNQPMCPVCSSGVLGPSVRCGECDVRYHKACWDYVGKCAIYGCWKAPSAVVLRRSPGPLPMENVPARLPARVESPSVSASNALWRNVAIMFAGAGVIPSVLAMAGGGGLSMFSMALIVCSFLSICGLGGGEEFDD